MNDLAKTEKIRIDFRIFLLENCIDMWIGYQCSIHPIIRKLTTNEYEFESCFKDEDGNMINYEPDIEISTPKMMVLSTLMGFTKSSIGVDEMISIIGEDKIVQLTRDVQFYNHLDYPGLFYQISFPEMCELVHLSNSGEIPKVEPFGFVYDGTDNIPFGRFLIMQIVNNTLIITDKNGIIVKDDVVIHQFGNSTQVLLPNIRLFSYIKDNK